MNRTVTLEERAQVAAFSRSRPSHLSQLMGETLWAVVGFSNSDFQPDAGPPPF